MKAFRGGAILLLAALCGCGNGGGGGDGDTGSASDEPPSPAYRVGGTVSGLTGTGLVLQNNRGDNLDVTADGPFIFPAALADGREYAVTVYTQPGASPPQTCSLVDGSGTIHGADVANVTVLCRTPWTKQYGSSGGEYVTGIARDAAGNLFIAGHTGGALEGNTSAGNDDAFLTKYDAAGTRLWTRQFGSADLDHAEGVAVDAAGNAYVAGFSNDVLPGETTAGGFDAFLASFDGDGNPRWMRQFGTVANDYAWGVATDRNGDVFVVGKARADISNAGLSCSSGCQYVAKFDAAGTRLWTGAYQYAYGNAIATDSRGDVYVAGNTLFNFDPLTNSLFTLDIAVTKWSGDGTIRWVRMLGTPGNEDAYGIAVDGNDNVIVAGYTSDHLVGATDAGGYDIVVAKYDADGVKQWARQFGSTLSEEAQAVAADSAGNVYVTGSTEGNFDGNSNAGTPGSNDLFVLKLDGGGTRQWSRELGTTRRDIGMGIVADADGNVYATGYTAGPLDGNTNAGSDDCFLVKYDSSGVKQ